MEWPHISTRMVLMASANCSSQLKRQPYNTQHDISPPKRCNNALMPMCSITTDQLGSHKVTMNRISQDLLATLHPNHPCPSHCMSTAHRSQKQDQQHRGPLLPPEKVPGSCLPPHPAISRSATIPPYMIAPYHLFDTNFLMQSGPSSRFVLSICHAWCAALAATAA